LLLVWPTENFGSVLRDCSRVLTTNPQSSKALYRSALALIALERFDEAIDCCERCLAFDEGNLGVRSVHDKAKKGQEAKEKKEREKQERLRKEAEEQRKLKQAFDVRPPLPIALCSSL
jgi:tetratricopeptide (TPR) repeat protein